MRYAVLSKCLKGSTQGMFQEEGLGKYQRKVVGSHSFLPHLLECQTLIDLYKETTPQVSSHSSLHRLLHYDHPPSQEDTLTHSPIYKRELLPPAFSPDSTRKTYTPVTTYNLINTTLSFPEFLQKILCLQQIIYQMETIQLFKKQNPVFIGNKYEDDIT